MRIHPAIEKKLEYFSYKHLPPHLGKISKYFHDTAHEIANLIEGPQANIALQKLIEAKDAAVRAAIKPEDLIK